MHTEISYVNNKVKIMETSIADLRLETETIRNKMSDVETHCETLSSHNEALKKENKLLNNKIEETVFSLKIKERDINDLEQYTRRNSVRVYGIHDTNKRESADETTEKVLNMLRNELGIALQPRDIDISHRIGRYRDDGNRVIICKFASRMDKIHVIRNRRKLKGKSIVIREDLTRKNQQVLEKVSQVQNVKAAWSEEGRIIAMLNDDSTVTVNITTDLSRPLARK